MLFSKNDIFRKDWMDVVFANRNREYGAYQLRMMSSKATNISLLIVLIVVGGLCGISFIPKKGNRVVEVTSDMPTMDERIIEVDDKIFEMPKEVEQPSATAQQVAQDVPAQDLIKFTEINPTDKAVVSEDVADAEEVKDRTKILASINMSGVKGGELIARGTFGTKKRDGGATGRSIGDPTGGGMGVETPFDAVEIMPEPREGMVAFRNWIGTNYQFTQGANDAGVSGVVRISFVVEKDGSLSSFVVQEDMGYGTGNEAIKLLKKAKKWKAGIQNGVPVRVAFTLPIRLSTVTQ